MEIANKVYGAQSKVFIQYPGTLVEIGSKLEKGMNIPKLRYENLEDEPYDLAGYAEVLGFEIALTELRDCGKWPDYQYLLEVSTTDSVQEVFNDRMFDVSLWMARYIALICDVTTMAEHSDKDSGQSFNTNRTNSKRDSVFVEAKK